jgi:hypothetical protein
VKKIDRVVRLLRGDEEQRETSSIYDTPTWVFFNFSLRMRGFEFQVFQERERKGGEGDGDGSTL